MGLGLNKEHLWQFLGADEVGSRIHTISGQVRKLSILIWNKRVRFQEKVINLKLLASKPQSDCGHIRRVPIGPEQAYL